MQISMKSIGLIGTGVVAGAALSLGLTAAAQHVADEHGPLPVDEIRQFADVFGDIKTNYVEPVDDKKLITAAITGMVSGLDPHSAYLDEQAYADLRQDMSGSFGGLGIQVKPQDGYLMVVKPMADTPASRAGIKENDIIQKIDDVDIKGMSSDDAIKRLRGAPKSKVTLSIQRDKEPKPIVMTLTREEIKLTSVDSKIVAPGIAYVAVSQFRDPTVEELAKQLEALSKQGPLKGIVLDLRNDPGGLLDSAVGVSAAFLKKDSLVVSSKGQLAEAQAKYFASKDRYQHGGEDVLRDLPAEYQTVPMVVLVNGASASAAEIVAGALQDYKRATVMGTQSFGKGSVQVILPLPPDRKTGVKLTISRYYTPLGRSIQNTGITPDIVVDDTADGNIFQFPRESDLQHHLSNLTVAANNANGNPTTDVDGPADPTAPSPTFKRPAKMFTFGGTDDFQLAQAINKLNGQPVVDADKTAAAQAAKAAAAPATVVPAAGTPAPATPAATPATPATPAADVPAVVPPK
jgi:carboxyl-terminal processing protease